MTNSFLVALLACHLLGDYYFQPPRLARFKKARLAGNFLHCTVYALPFAALLLFLVDGVVKTKVVPTAIILIVMLIVSHAIIDTGKWICFRLDWLREPHERWVLVIDQFLHLALITIVALSYGDALVEAAGNSGVLIFWRLAFFALALGKPTNVVFKALFSRYAPTSDPANSSPLAEDAHTHYPTAPTTPANPIGEAVTTTAASTVTTDTQPTEDGAGALIGILERLIMGAFACLGQFSAMGLVMAAKTLSRYDRISRNPRFAEYYLIGTLYSILAVTALYLLTFGLPA